MENQNEIIIYQPEESIKLEVRLEDETVWLTQAQMAELFQTTPQNVTIHIKSIYKEQELEIMGTCKEHLQVRQEGNRIVRRKQKFYNLDVIISVGYRVKSIYGTRFRQWATRILKDYLLKGYAINHRIEQLEKTVADHTENEEYPTIKLFEYKQAHDRFLLVDTEVYHIGASLKDLGKKWFAFSRLHIEPTELLERINK